jgi:hypothetical protein
MSKSKIADVGVNHKKMQKAGLRELTKRVREVIAMEHSVKAQLSGF